MLSNASAYHAMTVLLTSVLLLALAFLAQVVLWRVALPQRRTSALLVLFTIVPLIALALAWTAGRLPALSTAEIARVALFYVAFTLAYIVLYSAIEYGSPTLEIVARVAQAGDAGCDESELVGFFGGDKKLATRFGFMEEGGWVRNEGEIVTLTARGRFYAKLFDDAGRIFGLPKGG
jgi:hypothetical protein